MGIADLYDQRPRPVNVAEHAQHLLRLPWIWQGHSDRFVWALVNHVLLEEASLKGFVVYRNTMRRIGGRVRGQTVLTKTRLRAMIADEDTCRALVGSLQNGHLPSPPATLARHSAQAMCPHGTAAARLFFSWQMPHASLRLPTRGHLAGGCSEGFRHDAAIE